MFMNCLMTEADECEQLAHIHYIKVNIALIYKSFIHQKLVAHKKRQKTNLDKLNQRATCLQISQHGGRVEHWVEQN